jgi:hypothetical protein
MRAPRCRSHPSGLWARARNSLRVSGVLVRLARRDPHHPSRDSVAADAGQGAVAIESGKRQPAATTIRARPPPRTRLVPRREELIKLTVE